MIPIEFRGGSADGRRVEAPAMYRRYCRYTETQTGSPEVYRYSHDEPDGTAVFVLQLNVLEAFTIDTQDLELKTFPYAVKT